LRPFAFVVALIGYTPIYRVVNGSRRERFGLAFWDSSAVIKKAHRGGVSVFKLKIV